MLGSQPFQTNLPPTTSSIPTSAPSPYSSHITPLYHPTPSQPPSPSKRLKLQHDSYQDTPTSYEECPPLIYPSSAGMQQNIPRARHLPPHISIQRASEPSSPVTSVSTVSNHSTPSPSPSNVTIISDSSLHDFSLYEEGFPLQEVQPKQQLQARHMAPTIFSPNTSNPVVTGPGFSDGDSAWSPCYSSAAPGDFGKLPPQHHPQYFNGMIPGYPQEALEFARTQSMLRRAPHNHPEDDELPALSPSRATQVTASSRPSISENDMPATPIQSPGTAHAHTGGSLREGALSFVNEWMDGCLQSEIDCSSTLPKLSRTISDAVQDELFNPGIAPGTTRVYNETNDDSQSSQLPSIYQQAQNQHVRSSFARSSSPPQGAFLPVRGYHITRAQRDCGAEHDAQALRENIHREYEMQKDPKTISPKDAYIEYHEPEEDEVRGSLFSSQHDDAYSQSGDALSSGGSYRGSVDEDEHDIKQESSQMGYHLPLLSPNVSHPFSHELLDPVYAWAEPRPSQNGHEFEGRPPFDDDYDTHMSGSFQRPEDTTANSGAYSCTVHGCTQRFPTASKMSKHRREAHRHGTPMSRDAGVRAQHQGPHRCTRINPTTGKPCNTIFSRPYDLTRHEDTIHNTTREKVRCEICKDEKTFSRHDALTRHKKVKHGIDK